MESRTARRIFIVLSVALLPLMIAASWHFGVTWDEKSRHYYGQQVYAYLTGRLGRSAFPADDSSVWYGGLFDVICVAVEHWVTLDRYVLRHLINAIFGWVGIVYCGRLAGRLFGRWAGVLALLLLVLSPRYFGHSMNNPKDLPFAAMTVVGLYYLSTVSPTWPYVSASTASKIVVSLALALNIRAGALLYLGYLGLLVGVYLLAERSWGPRRLADTALRLAGIVVATLVLGTVFWPWAQGSPLVRPVEAALGFAHFPFGGALLFAGRQYDAEALPRWYAPWYFLITTPPVVLAGVALSALPVGARFGWRRAALWFVFLFPIAVVLVEHSTLYDGIRHLLFLYPILAVLAAAGWTEWVAPRHGAVVRGIAGAALAAGLASILVFNVQAFPNQVAYFNAIVGGPKGALARYDLDYWGNCILQATAWSAEAARLSGVPIAVSGNADQIVDLDSQRFHELYFIHPSEGRDELGIMLNRGPIDGVTELSNRKDALYRVEMPDGTPLCVVLPGPRFDELKPHFVAPPR